MAKKKLTVKGANFNPDFKGANEGSWIFKIFVAQQGIDSVELDEFESRLQAAAYEIASDLDLRQGDIAFPACPVSSLHTS